MFSGSSLPSTHSTPPPLDICCIIKAMALTVLPTPVMPAAKKCLIMLWLEILTGAPESAQYPIKYPSAKDSRPMGLALTMPSVVLSTEGQHSRLRPARAPKAPPHNAHIAPAQWAGSPHPSALQVGALDTTAALPSKAAHACWGRAESQLLPSSLGASPRARSSPSCTNQDHRRARCSALAFTSAGLSAQGPQPLGPFNQPGCENALKRWVKSLTL